MPLSTVTITGSWVTPSNTPASGQVVITPLVEVTGGGSIVADVPVVVPLVAGAISATLVNNMQATNLQYQITEQIVGAPTVTYVVVPVGATLDLSTAPRVALTSVTLNPNWPLLSIAADFTQGPPALPGAGQVSLNAPSRRNAVRQIQVDRGRQYELDQVQAGTCALDITDPLEYLDPRNTNSPFNQSGNTITPYRAMQIGAWRNTTTGDLAGNMLNSANPIPGETWLARNGVPTPYGWDSGFESWYVSTAASGITQTVVGSPADGAFTVWQCVAASAASTFTYYPRVTPGVAYTVTADVYATTGVTVTLTWAGSVSTSTTGSYQTLTLAFVGDTTGGLVLSVPTAAGGYPGTFYLANVRLTGTTPGWSQTAGSAMQYTTAQAQAGHYSLGTTMQSASDSMTAPMPTVPGITYTVSAYVYPAAAGTTVRMSGAGHTVDATAAGTWQRVTLTFTATDAITRISWLAPVATGGYPAVFYLDSIQLEVGPVASTFTTTGPTFFPLYTGYIETYPIRWDINGTLGVRPLTGVDALSVLSRTEINQSYAATIAADLPYLVIPFNDLALPQVVALPRGGSPMLGYQNLGTQGAVNFQGDTFLDSNPAVVVTQQNTAPATTGNTAYITYLGTLNSNLGMNPQAFTIECWVRFTAGSVFFGAGSVNVVGGENVNAEPRGPAIYTGWYTQNGRLYWTFQDSAAHSTLGLLPSSGSSWAGYPDGNWHYVAIQLLGSSQAAAIVDNVIGTPVGITTATVATLLNNFFVDAQVYTGEPVCTLSVANLACYPQALSNAQVLAHYNRGAGYVNEVAGARVLRLLTTYWAGPVNVAAGYRQFAADYTYNTRFMLDVLQEIQETERGLVYASAAGVVVFEDSTTRYTTNLASKWVFGENPAGANPVEYPILDLSEVLDPTYTFTQCNLSRPGNLNFQPLPNPLPTNPPYGQRVLTQEVQVTTDFDLNQAGVFYLNRYATPQVRVDTLVLNPAANPALWSVVLSLEISQRITVTRRTPSGFVSSSDYYVEHITHSIDVARGHWLVTLQCSPVFVTTPWILGDTTYGVLGTSTAPIY